MNSNISNNGSGLLETIIAVSIFGIILVGFVQSIISFSTTEIKSRYRLEASLAAQEGIEIAYNISQTDWENFRQLNGFYSLSFSETSVELVPGSQQLESNPKLTRRILIEQAKHTPVTYQLTQTGDISQTTFRITSQVYWNNQKPDQQIEYTLYVTKP